MLGHPEVITKNFDLTLKTYFGFAKVKILPPSNLFLPVLPYKFQDNLYFPLCRQCLEEKISGNCQHSDKEKLLKSTWTTIELKKALEKGYQILKIYEVLHYEKKSNTLFQEYMQSWLKLKIEATGWPANVNTNDEQILYINDWCNRNGVQINKNSVVKNPALRTIAKLMLNSFWGKLAQRPNLKQTSIVKSYNDYLQLLTDPKVEILGEVMPSENTLVVSWQFSKDQFSHPGNVSVAIASFVTAYARLYLYEIMDSLEKWKPNSLLYFDTGEKCIFKFFIY